MKLNAKHYKAIECLYEGMTKDATAKECDISRTTLYEWMKREEFQKAMRDYIRKRTSYVALKGMSAIEQVLANPEAKDSDRLRAAEKALDMLTAADDLTENAVTLHVDYV